MEKINRGRIIAVICIFGVLMVLLAGRLAYIQIVCHDEFSSAVKIQYEIPIEGLDTRGTILDRNGTALTGGVKEYYYIIPKRKQSQELSLLTRHIEGRQVAKDSSEYLVYRTSKFDEETSDILKEKFDAYVFATTARYSDEQTACHLIGYLNENQKTGVSGIELMKQDVLEASGSNLTLWADAAGNVIKGIAPAINGKGFSKGVLKDRSVLTTIDRRLQHVCEKSLSDKTDSGAAVVMDGESGEILAWASAPTFNPNTIEEYLIGDGDCLINKVSQGAYAPGSVFKIVTAAAALENGICTAEQEFECMGEATVEGVTLSCSTAPEEGHGMIDMEEAMAYSCNCYFAQLGDMVGSDKISEMAQKFGFGSRVLTDFPEETTGNMPKEDEVGPWDVSNLSIGQGQILATPLQVMKMTAIIAGGGTAPKPHVIMEESAESTAELPQDRIISRQTASAIEEMLSQVMEYGTGTAAWPVPVFGKTGTAEAGGADNPIKNCWFTGYCDIGEKTYVITVLAEDGSSGSHNALPVFRNIVDFLQKQEEFKASADLCIFEELSGKTFP